MEIVKFNNTEFNQVSPTMGLRDYITTEHANVAAPVINGRYPETGDKANLEAEMYMYVVSGIGKIAIHGTLYDIKGGDVVFVDKNEPYHYEQCQSLLVVLFSTPAFDPEKYVDVSTDNL